MPSDADCDGLHLVHEPVARRCVLVRIPPRQLSSGGPTSSSGGHWKNGELPLADQSPHHGLWPGLNKRATTRRASRAHATACGPFSFVVTSRIFSSLSLCSREESNLDHELRKLAFYPLNYGSVCFLYHKPINSARCSPMCGPCSSSSICF